jgi:hypothetical protein
MTEDVKLTKQSEAILNKLREDVEHHRLTPDELAKVRKGLALLESLGVFAGVIIKAAAIVGSGAMLWQFLQGKGTGQ